jgi:hypothetical protein
MRGIVDHQRAGMNPFQQVRRRDVGKIEGRILSHQNDIEMRKFHSLAIVKRKMVPESVAYGKGLHGGENLTIAQSDAIRRVVEERVSALLRLEEQSERGIAADVDPFDRIHLNCNA